MKPLSFFSSQSYLLKDNDGEKYVVKHYNAVTSIKWYFIVPTFKIYPFVSSPRERMKRELNFMTYKWREVNVPKIIDFDLDSCVIYREYIEGNEPKDLKDFELIGRTLSIIHNNNFVLGDTKVNNFLVDKERRNVYVIDAEQSLQSDSVKYKSWDLLVLLFFIALENIYDVKRFEEITISILESYKPSKDIIRGILNIKNAPLLSFFPPIHLEHLRKITMQFL